MFRTFRIFNGDRNSAKQVGAVCEHLTQAHEQVATWFASNPEAGATGWGVIIVDSDGDEVLQS